MMSEILDTGKMRDVLGDLMKPFTPEQIEDLLDRLEQAQNERDTLQADLDAAVSVATVGTGFSAKYVDRRYQAGRNTGSTEGYERGYQAGLAAGRTYADELATLQAATPVAVDKGSVPSDIAETLDKALGAWIVNVAADHATGHASSDDRKECNRRYDAALAWLEQQRRPLAQQDSQEEVGNGN